MLLSTALRRQPLLRASSAAYKSLLRPSLVSSRCIHRLPALQYDEEFSKNGVAGAMTAAGFDLAWTQYQSFLLDKLNKLTAGTKDEQSTTKDLFIKYARQADNAALFNYASMAHNNHFFFRSLSPNPQPPTSTLKTDIDNSFSSMDSLRETFIATANAMFGPGFVWLVAVRDSGSVTGWRLAILNTYNAGSPYPGAHYRLQGVDMATSDTDVVAGEHPAAFSLRRGDQVGTFGLSSSGRPPSSKQFGPGGQDLEVLMCVNTWEHVWLQDWGVGGKRGFLEAIWNVIDWEVVSRHYKAGPSRSQNRPSFV